MNTYFDIIRIIENSPIDKGLFVRVFYPTGSHEWLPVDKSEYLRQLKMITYPDSNPFPCLFEVENDGEMYIHPKVANPKSISEYKEGDKVKFRLNGMGGLVTVDLKLTKI